MEDDPDPIPGDEMSRPRGPAVAADKSIEELAKEQAAHLVVQADEMSRLHSRKEGERRKKEEDQEEEQRKKQKREGQESGHSTAGYEITNPYERYRAALQENYDPGNHYGSLAEADMTEYQAFMRRREELTLRMAHARDPEARRIVGLVRDIEAADYMAVTDRRIAGRNEYVTQNPDSPSAVWHRERAAKFEAESKEKRQQYREATTQRSHARDGSTEKSGERGVDGEVRDAAEETSKRQRHQTTAESNHARDGSPVKSKARGADGVVRNAEEDSNKRQEKEAVERRQTSGSTRNKDAENLVHEVMKGRELSPEKAEKIAKILERHQQFESALNSRPTGQTRGKGSARS